MKKEDTVLAGFHAVSSRMKRDSSSIRIVYYDPKRRDQRMRRMIEEIEKAGIRLMQADNNRLDGFSHEVPHQGLIALAAPIDIGMSFDTLMDNLAGNPLLLLLDGVTEKLSGAVKAQGDCPYLSEEDARQYFDCEAEYIDGTEYGICLGPKESRLVTSIEETIREGRN